MTSGIGGGTPSVSHCGIVIWVVRVVQLFHQQINHLVVERHFQQGSQQPPY